jgi:hypothetical protein
VFLNKNKVWGTAKAKECRFWPLEMKAIVRQNVIPVGTLVEEVALGYVLLPVHGVCWSVSFNSCLIDVWYSLTALLNETAKIP